MRFKYYLRGAGIGVIAATLILSIAFLFHDNISDEEVIRRAMKLGMVMQENAPGTLADPTLQDNAQADQQTVTDEDPLTEPDQTGSDPDQNGSDQSSPDQTDSDPDDPNPAGSGEDTSDQNPSDQTSDGAGSSSSDNDNDSSDSKPDEKKDKPPKKEADEKKDTAESSDEVEIVIESGDVSRMVSAKVFEAGLVEDADEFNSYLGSHDYDNMLQPGSYKIKKGSSFRQIAQILTRQ